MYIYEWDYTKKKKNVETSILRCMNRYQLLPMKKCHQV